MLVQSLSPSSSSASRAATLPSSQKDDGTFVYISMSILFLFFLVFPWRNHCRCYCSVHTAQFSSTLLPFSAATTTTQMTVAAATTTATDSPCLTARPAMQVERIEMTFISIGCAIISHATINLCGVRRRNGIYILFTVAVILIVSNIRLCMRV